MIHSDGKNQYENNRFEFWQWSAPILQTPEEVIDKVHELGLVGRVVKDIFTIGRGYNWSESQIGDLAYAMMEMMTPAERASVPNPNDVLPTGVNFLCVAEVDEPLLIVFEDGDVLGISFDEGSCVRMEMNTIPVTIKPGINPKNFHASRLFRDMIGQRITSVEVTASTQEPNFTGSHGLHLTDQDSYISTVALVYGGGSFRNPSRKLSFEAEFDYGDISLKDEYGQYLTFPATDMPWVVEGFVHPTLFE